jgi:hypothetical protein
MQRQAREAANRWAGPLPNVASVWERFADLVGEVEQLDQARRAAERTGRQ